MSDVPVYMVVNLKITGLESYGKYERGFFPLLKKYDGQFITYDDNPDSLEGDVPREGRMIIFQFPCEEKARAWYADPEYQTLAEFRRAGTSLDFLAMVRGLPPRK
jgi:uncharacterized protein (DUF1330 family)|tara:strand:- start:288 stop:602 length:315 start_codon:yes stop_codon:yes gene_type:complete